MLGEPGRVFLPLQHDAHFAGAALKSGKQTLDAERTANHRAPAARLLTGNGPDMFAERHTDIRSHDRRMAEFQALNEELCRLGITRCDEQGVGYGPANEIHRRARYDPGLLGNSE